MIERLWIMGIQAAVLIGAVLLIRLFLKRCSKGYSYCLWILVLLRLLCPVFIESKASLQPDFKNIKVLSPVGEAIMQFSSAASFAEGGTVLPEYVLEEDTAQVYGKNSQTGNFVASGRTRGDQDETMQDPFSFLAKWIFGVWTPLRGLKLMWAAGVIVLLVWFTIQYLEIRKRVSVAVREEDNVFRCEHIASPFVMGIFRPKIYLPYGVDEKDKKYILAHERIHIRHRDPFVRAAGILALCLHWWNPFVWYGIYKMTQDMEMLCDETVLAKAAGEDRKAYSTALLHAAMKQNGFSVVLPFGETKTEQRIRNILKEKKKGIFITVFAGSLFLGCAASFLTVPFSAEAKEDMDLEGIQRAYAEVQKKRENILLENLTAMQQNLLEHQEEIEALSKAAEKQSMELTQQLSESVQHRDGFKEPLLIYEETPYSMTKEEVSDKENRLAVRALQELYDLTGTQVESCFYSCCDNAFYFGMEKGDITHSRNFYFRAYGEKDGYSELSVSSMGMANARRVWFSPVQQYEVPAHMEKLSYGEQAVWFLERSAVFQGGSITGTGLAYEQEPELIRIFMEDGTFYEVQLDPAIQAVDSIYGPYPEGFEH